MIVASYLIIQCGTECWGSNHYLVIQYSAMIHITARRGGGGGVCDPGNDINTSNSVSSPPQSAV